METEFRVGEVFAKSLSILFANIVPFLTISFVVTVPTSAIDIYEAIQFEAGADPNPFLSLGGVLLGLVLGPIATGAITFGVIQQLRDQHPPMGTCLAVGFRRLLPVLVVAILVGLVTGLGFVLLIVPGLWFMCRLWVSIPVAVTERAGIIGAMHRSDQLTKGSRWRILGLVLLIMIIYLGAVMMVATVSVVALHSVLAQTILMIPLAVFATAWQASAQAVSYYTLRSMKEMIDVDQIAAVFD